MSYFEISDLLSITASHERNCMQVVFRSDEHEVVVSLTEEQMKTLHILTLSYQPGMPGFNQFHEDRLNQS